MIAEVRDLGRTNYADTYAEMKSFTDQRDSTASDQIWLTEHDRVFTQGQAGKTEHLLAPGDIPVVQSDRGGQVTYHGPGQIVCYLLFDLRRLDMTVRDLVSGIEQSVVGTIARFGISGVTRRDAPGVYVRGAKLAALGLRVRKGCSYHGLSLNVGMDLEPFTRINPCGLTGLTVTQLADLGGPADIESVKPALVASLLATFGFSCRTCGNLDSGSV